MRHGYKFGGGIRLGCVGRTADRGQQEPEKSATKDDPWEGVQWDRLRERALARLPLPLLIHLDFPDSDPGPATPGLSSSIEPRGMH